MEKSNILEMFRKTGALLNGHFLLTSGLHSSQYFQCAKVLQFPDIAESLCSQIADHFAEETIDAVVAPAIGGIVVGQEVARRLKTRALFAERENGQMTLRRGFEINHGEQVLVVEDVITTGGSVREVLELTKSLGALPVGVGCIVNRSTGKVDFGLNIFSVTSLNIDAVTSQECQLCAENVQLVKPGSRSFH